MCAQWRGGIRESYREVDGGVGVGGKRRSEANRGTVASRGREVGPDGRGGGNEMK